MLILSEFFRQYTDDDTQEEVNSHCQIAAHYLKSGYFVIDVAATFPYELVTGNYFTSLIRLLRLLKINKLINLVDFKPLKAVVEWYYKNDRRGKRVVITFVMTHVFEIFSLILTTITIIFFLGCSFYIISANLNTQWNYDHGMYFINQPNFV